MKIVSFKDEEILKRELDNNKVIGFPTETVFGLGARFDSIDAFNNLVKVKNRSPEKPFTLMCCDYQQIKDYVKLNDIALKIIKKFMPGEITLLVKVKKDVPYYLHLNSEYLGFRIPKSEKLLNFLRFYGKPLLVPSANKAGENPALSTQELIDTFDGEIDYVVDGECNTTIPSTIIKVDDNINIVREGPISLEEIMEAIK